MTARERVLEVLRAHPADTFTAAQLARAAGLTVRRFYNLGAIWTIADVGWQRTRHGRKRTYRLLPSGRAPSAMRPAPHLLRHLRMAVRCLHAAADELYEAANNRPDLRIAVAPHRRAARQSAKIVMALVDGLTLEMS